MIETKQENSPQGKPPKAKKELSEEQKQKQKKLIAYPLVGVLFVGVMWLIFAPSEKEKKQLQVGFNTEIPAPISNTLHDDKQKAYEEELLHRKQQERRQLQDLASMFDGEQVIEENVSIEGPKAKPQGSSGSSRPKQHIEASANAYRDINRTLGNFYDTPKEDVEKQELKQQLEEMQKQMEQMQSTPKVTMDEQLALMEKSYELAARYMPSTQQGHTEVAENPEKQIETYKNGKAVINSVGQVHTSIVSGLSQPLSDSVFIAEYSKPRNYGFNTAIGTVEQLQKNTIKACIHDNQTIVDGQAVRMRLLEPMRAGNTTLPQNAIITGMGKIQGERLAITISTLEYQGMIIPVDLLAIDTDGQQGIFIPGSMEMNAIKEIAANLGGNLGTTINLNQQSAGEQILTDLGKGAIQGASQYIAKKIRIVKVHLKAGYQIMLYQDKQ
ncbi:MAG: conjugative transposon protein TraM [Bacteroidales bacterium]